MTDEMVRLRTDVVLSCISGKEPPLYDYLKSLDGMRLTKQDMAALSIAAPVSPYSMKDLGSPALPSEMVIPQNYRSYLAGHTKLSNSYLADWPLANADNRFGEHHPFGMKSNSCPLLHGSAWGEPMYVDHLFEFISHIQEEDQLEKAEENTPAHKHKEGERRIRLNRNDYNGNDAYRVFGRPNTSLLDLYIRDVNRYESHEEWEETKRDQLNNSFGMLPYLFGLEWNTKEQGEILIDMMKELAITEKHDTPESKTIRNKMKEKAGISWDRVLRSWRDRFTPLKAWWLRPSDRHGPTTSPVENTPHDHLIHPFIEDNESHNYHWWEPFQYWGGVGRSGDSLRSMLSQSYPKIFNDGWLSDFLVDAIEVDGPHMVSGSHFPSLASENSSSFASHSPISIGDVDFERKRSSWSHAANHHHLHPSEITGQGSRMTIPPQAFSISQFGRAMQGIADLGVPRVGKYRIDHPNSNADFMNLHNTHYTNTDNALAMKMLEMAHGLRQQHGNDIFAPMNGDKTANTLARGNIQQLASAANYALMRENKIHPTSDKIAPPIFNTGNTDAWGHDMSATLGWKWDPRGQQVSFDVKAQPFTLAQRTAHEGLINGIDPMHMHKPIHNKTREIHALSPSMSGYPTISHDLHKSDDDYEPTGVFESLIEPAHVVHDLDDMDTLKGFSGEWVVQKKPKGKHIMVKKKGKSVDPVSLPSAVKKSLKDTIKGNATFDAYLEGDVLSVVDLLVHKDTDMSLEPLSDRVNTLRTLYSTTENVHFPSPNTCVTTDEDGLIKTIATMDRTDLLIRDAHSTFMKGKEVHPKWVLYPQDDISKSNPLPPLPEMSLKGNHIILEYPAIYEPVIVKTAFDEVGFFVEEYEGAPHLVKHAKTQFSLWSPVAGLFLKEGAIGGANGAATGTFTSSDSGSLKPLHSVRKRPIKRKSLDKAPEVLTEEEGVDDEHNSISTIMRHARRAIANEETSLKEKKLISMVEGLTSDNLDLYGGEYGLEQTESGEWTVNEAIDDDIAEKFAFPRMNRASADGGAWSGMQGDITAPTGPTEITDEENTTFGDPRENQEEVNMNEMFKPLSMVVSTEDGDAVLEMKEGRAILRYPAKEKYHDERENDVLPALRDDDAL